MPSSRARFEPPPSSARPSSRYISAERISLPRFSSSASHNGASRRQETDRGPDDIEELFEDDETLDDVIMAVDVRKETMGCCYYIARDQKLCFMEDIRLADAQMVETLRINVQPSLILLSNRVDDAVDTLLQPDDGDANSGRLTSIHLPYVLERRPSSEFNYDAAKNKLVYLDIDSDNGPETTMHVAGDVDMVNAASEGQNIPGVGRQARLLRLNGWVDLESRVTVGCAGAILTYLKRRRAAAYLPGDEVLNSAFRVRTIEMFSMADMMFVNAETYSSLQIIHAETHPASHNQGPTKSASGSKEGLSIYGLFQQFARSPQGKHQLRQYFLRPTLNRKLIKERLDTISVLTRPENQFVLEGLTKALKTVQNMSAVLINLQKGVGSTAEISGGIKRSIWRNLSQFALSALKIRDLVGDIPSQGRPPVILQVLREFDPHVLGQVAQLIKDTVDFRASVEQHRTVVNVGVDDELDTLRHTYDGLDSLLSEVRRRLLETTTFDVNSDLNVIYFPQIGFLILLPLDINTGRGMNEDLFDPEGSWVRMFSTDAEVYYKSHEMRELDQHFGDIYGIICDKEIEIIYHLAQRVLAHEEIIRTCSTICGELDSLCALAHGAKTYKLTRPVVTKANVIQIEGGRHLLQERTVRSFVANDTLLVGGPGDDEEGTERFTQRDAPRGTARTVGSANGPTSGPSMLIMTGPNYSGKSVYLKQVALIVYMAHVGSFVPADHARIGLTDKLLTRVTTRESVSKMQSTFMSDLQQVALAIKLATRRSLIIIDEFGKGTESSDGAGLACGVFEYFLSLGTERPKVLGATHFHEIFEHGFLRPSGELEFAHMEVQVDPHAEQVEHQITYLYNLRKGRSTSSYGTVCAAINGIDPSIIKRAEDLTLLSARGEDLVSACAYMTDEEKRELEIAERIAQRFLAPTFNDDIHTHNQTQSQGRGPRNGGMNADPRSLLQEILDLH
ncbi:MAG: Translation elongation factor 1 beta [Watsoniomyces obsoletus]|nr:MAG: Translation elongation factor 1 beta [Watsoniomyces obsoletus]